MYFHEFFEDPLSVAPLCIYICDYIYLCMGAGGRECTLNEIIYPKSLAPQVLKNTGSYSFYIAALRVK